MLIKIDNLTFRVKWYHGYDKDGCRMTTCRIATIKDSDATPTIGRARCSKQDIFSRDVGRRVSMSRALKPFERDSRRLFWLTYFSRTSKCSSIVQDIRSHAEVS